jgi:hypothetical protein
LDVIIEMRKSALEHRGNALGESHSVDKMDKAPDMEQVVIDLTDDMDDSS